MKRIVVIVLMFLVILVSGCHKSDIPVDSKLVIINIDEGLIDQLDYYMVGERIKSLGYKVKYDTSWYKLAAASKQVSKLTKIKAFFGIFPKKDKTVNSRTLQLDKAFPYIDFTQASGNEIKFYKKHFYFAPKENHWSFDEKSLPLYIFLKIYNWRNCVDVSGYILRDSEKEVRQKLVNKYFHFEDSILDDKNLAVLQRIRNEKCPVGVHVRRGDDAVHGVASSAQYYVKAVNKVKEMFPDASFFFISDEPDYVKNKLLPEFGENIKIEIIDINDVDSCYKDLFLLSECKHQIRSFGSMGAIAYLINRYPGKKLIAPRIVREYRNIKPDLIIEE
jgi:hypothetical protein